MKIAVCIKRVPDSETRVKIASDGKSLDEAGVKFILNPYDEFAVEEALRRKEQATPPREGGGGRARAGGKTGGWGRLGASPSPPFPPPKRGQKEPRYPALKGIMAAKKKPLQVKPATLGAGGLEVLALTPPPQR